MTAPTLQPGQQWRAFGGTLQQYSHESTSTKSTMRFTVFLPPTASETNKVPVLYFLPGAMGDDERVFMKAPNIMKAAAERGIAVVSPDASPRGCGIPGEDHRWDFGTGASFYVDATEPKWKEHYNMYTYVTKELPALLAATLPIRTDRQSIMGHSMGGHGALMIALRNPTQYRSVSAFAPVTHVAASSRGSHALTGYLGNDQEAWKEYDATLLMLKQGPIEPEILIEQGTDDEFLAKQQLQPEAFEQACEHVGQRLTLRRQEGYDHSYYFIASFVEQHLFFHAKALLRP